MSKQADTFRLYPTHKPQERLPWTLDRASELYNAALQQRRDAYRMVGKHINYYDQANQRPEIKQEREEYQDIHSQVLQDVLRKVDKAFKASRQLLNSYGTIVFEELQPANMSKRAKPKPDENGTYLPNAGSAKSG